MSGVAVHGNTPFDVPFISQIDGNLWQGGCQTGLQLPHFFKHIVSLYPWEAYRINHDMNSQTYVKMYDSLEQSMEQVDAIAEWINICVKDGPTLVHCQAGLNRSSLVAARSLMLRDDNFDAGSKNHTAESAIALLRERRSPACLCNSAFEEHLRSL
jgi:protein-tyrosine phosphatase